MKLKKCSDCGKKPKKELVHAGPGDVFVIYCDCKERFSISAKSWNKSNSKPKELK